MRTATAQIVPSSPVRLRILPFSGPDAAWDEFVGNAENSTFAHLSAWREIMDLMGHECLYRVAVDESGKWHGVLPLARVKNALFGNNLRSLPFLNYGGPLGSPSARGELVAAALREAHRSGADSLELRTRHEVPAPLPASERKVTVLLDLPASAEVLWSDQFRSKLRNLILRPQKEGLEARFGIDQLGAFYEVFAVNMRDLGTPVLPRRFFERVARTFADRLVVGAVYLGERPMAVGCGFIWQDEYEMTWASGLREFSHLKPNMFLYWKFMTHLIERGVRTFNFGRSTPGTGTHQFKTQWGGRDVPLPWVAWSRDPAAGEDATESRTMRLARDTWQRLPLPVANRLGPLVAPLLPWW